MSKGRSIFVDQFRDYLVLALGATLLKRQSSKESFRYKMPGDKETIVISKLKRGKYKLPPRAREHYRIFEYHYGLNPAAVGLRFSSTLERRKAKAKLIERDGAFCWYCRAPETEELLLTIEHLLSVSCGGPKPLENLCLACEACNQEAGNMAIVEKVALRERLLRSSVHV